MKLTDIFEADELPTFEGQPSKEDYWDMPAYSDTAELPARLMPNLEEKIGKLNKRAKKLGVPEITISVIGEKDIPVKDSNGEPDPYGKTVKWLIVKVEGEAPKLAGWQFVATIQHKEGGNVIRSVPSQEDPEALKKFYEARPDYCDHCHTKRRRVDTFIVKNDQGEYKQIGRNCIKDFLGGKDPKAILWYVSILDRLSGIVKEVEDDDGQWSTGGGGSRYYEAPIDRVLTAAAGAVRLYGYTKASSENGHPTSQVVRAAVFSNPTYMHKDSIERQWYSALSQPSEEDQAKAKEVLAWWATVPQQQKDDNTFLHNIDVILKGSKVGTRDLGFVVGIFPVYARAMGEIKDRERKAPKSNEYIGQPGEKIPPTKITVTRIRVTTSYYGYRPTEVQIVAMEDEAGNAYTWFNNSSMEMKEGQTAFITGTVKKHEDFNGRKQTHLTRVKIVPENAPVKPAKQPRAAKPVQQTPQTNTGEPRPSASPGREGSKAALAAAKYKELVDAGTPPSRGEFIRILQGEPFNMTPAGASTYYAKIKKALSEGIQLSELDKYLIEANINTSTTSGSTQMKFLTELMNVRRLQDDDNLQKEPDTDQEGQVSYEDEPQPEEQQGEEDPFADMYDEEQPEDELGGLEGEGEPEEPTDPNRAGLIRHVKGAHLVYKREQDDGTYEEMWIYNSGEFKKDIQVKKAILAGTDIPPNATQSPDGAQTVKMWSAGNADIVHITGLPQ